MIESAIDAVARGAEIAEKTSVAFEELAGKVNEVQATVSEISAASNEHAADIQQVNTGVDQISAVVQTNSATSEESAASSEELSGQAAMLNNLVRQFKLASGNGYAAPPAPVTTETRSSYYDDEDAYQDKY